MTQTSLIIIILIFISACSTVASREDNIVAATRKPKIKEEGRTSTYIQKVDKAFIGMTVEELKEAYPNAIFKEEPLYEYGVDSEGTGLLVIENNEPLLFAWTLEDDNKIHSLTVLSPKIKVDSNVHVGMTVQEFLEKYPNSTLAINLIDDRFEFIHIMDKKYSIEFITTDSSRVGNYDFSEAEPEFKSLNRPEATIDRIEILK
ncbi:hypothetical protein [Cesiribacter sp. SM1]|uniref:hypothetical protein n=1 Tax=Cesiribacter sp. SM1 TaxID=2861196 RepID=UPI001CD5999C|nr:hypothetical protein [Cesiribacter sp. SM1]